MRRLGAVIAMPQEAADILADARFAWTQTGRDAWTSGAYPLKLELSGVGKVFASWACASLAADCDLILGMGTSGGLRAEPVGSRWLAAEFVEHDMEAAGIGYEPGVTPFARMAGPVIRAVGPETLALAEAAAAAAGLAVSRARVASGDAFIADPQRAHALAERTGAQLCDMESAAIAKLCAFRCGPGGSKDGGVEFFAFRSVSDNADHQAARSWAEQVKSAAADFDAFLYEFVRLLQA